MIIFKKVKDDRDTLIKSEVEAEITFEVHEEAHVKDLLYEFRQFMLALGYSESLVNEYLDIDGLIC